MTDDINFENLLNPKKFLRIQNQFMYLNANLNNPENYFSNVQLDDFGFNMNNLFSGSTKNDEKYKTYFFRDFLMHNLDLKEDFLNNYFAEFEKLKLINGNLRLHYFQNINCLLEYEELNKKASHLRNDIKEIIINEIELCIDRIQKSKNENTFLGEKIFFKMIRQDVLVFFHLLRENGIIKWHSNSELKILIENNFKSYDEETEDFKNLKIGRKVLSDFSNGHRNINPSIKKLKKILQNDDFYNTK